MADRKLFVTVGTTKFNSLIREVTTNDALKTLAKLGFSDILLQIGRGEYEPSNVNDASDIPHVSYYRLKDSISDDIAQADLVISHAGAGSIIDSLSAGKSVLVVVNDELMDNHQTELAEKLAAEGHLHYCGVRSLVPSLKSLDFKVLKPFLPGEPEKFADHLDQIMGFW
uniref:UDP-N-acetylglucosamine transferase subunit ALG13 n=2 Tax=Arion vulgaris TaxID=1028688 RepID=A0A0B7AAC8_9EUPU